MSQLGRQVTMRSQLKASFFPSDWLSQGSPMFQYIFLYHTVQGQSEQKAEDYR